VFFVIVALVGTEAALQLGKETNKAMKTAITVFNERVAPVFDVAGQVLVVDIEQDRIVHEEIVDISAAQAGDKMARLKQLGVGQIICGAISRPMQAEVEAQGIRVAGFVAGNVRDILQAFIENRLDNATFAMPGCRGKGWGRGCGRQHQCRNRHGAGNGRMR
jgi:predicted Fe-Mo cluster-binding NifX family protein